VEVQAPPGMIYRHLRDLEENGLVESNWETEGTGSAKRVYQLTWEGNEVLDFLNHLPAETSGKVIKHC
jgi:DNA-binding PadR family transcriptional regulator